MCICIWEMFVVPISYYFENQRMRVINSLRHEHSFLVDVVCKKKSINFKSILQQVVADAGEDRIEPVAAEQEEEEEEKADQSSLIEQQFDPELKMRKINELLNMIGKTTY